MKSVYSTLLDKLRKSFHHGLARNESIKRQVEIRDERSSPTDMQWGLSLQRPFNGLSQTIHLKGLIFLLVICFGSTFFIT